MSERRGPPPLPSEAPAADPALEAAELRRFADRTVAGLEGCLQADGALLDPATGQPVPDDHYAATFTALALAVREPDDRRWRQLVERWVVLPAERRGHAPFNRLALLLLRDTAQHRGPLSSPDEELLSRALEACRTAERYPSNNWVLLARACALLEAPAGPARAAAAARLSEALAQWLTPAGGFIDFPEQPGDGPVSTPLAYHAKLLLVLLLVRLGAPDACREVEPALARGLAWLLAFTDESGRAGGFGRSSHALYGYACVLALCAQGLRAGDERSRRVWAVGSRRVRLLLESARRDDRLLSITLNPATGADGGWDDYMHLVVYNAWTAGLLTWLLAQPDEDALPLPEPDFTALGARPEALACDERAGLLAARGQRGLLCAALAGQPVQGYAPGVADLRWGGALPFQLVLDGQAVIAPPVRVPLDALRAQPALAGWTPVIEYGGRLYGLQRFDHVERHGEGEQLTLVARGVPTALAPDAAAAGPAWMAAQVDHYLLGGRRRRTRGLAPDALDGHRATVVLAFDGRAGWLAQVVVLHGVTTEARLLNPHGHALLPAGRVLPLRAKRWGESAGPRAGGAATPRDEVVLPCSLAGARGACAEPLTWPAQDAVLVTLLGPSGARPDEPLPIRWDGARRLLLLSWAEVGPL